ncbi:hypothetical protein TTHMIC_00014 [Tetrahymena thermophila SB210]|uniref:USP domain-containing protein n=1 Tax=Tetrahymena thermophila (strain SB210) TaxID=312017 RepID=A0A1B9C261_TETTS|nr:hypothetical protein TTHMIC_00014 [Tetrahymena thermophila SB210]
MYYQQTHTNLQKDKQIDNTSKISDSEKISKKCSNLELFYKFCLFFDEFKKLICKNQSKISELIICILNDDQLKIKCYEDLENYIYRHQSNSRNYYTLFDSLNNMISSNQELKKIFWVQFKIETSQYYIQQQQELFLNLQKHDEKSDLVQNIIKYYKSKNNIKVLDIKIEKAPQVLLFQYHSSKNQKADQKISFYSITNIYYQYQLLMDLTEEKEDLVFHQLVYIQLNTNSLQIIEKFKQLKTEGQKSEINKVCSSDKEKQEDKAVEISPKKENQNSCIIDIPSKQSEKIEKEYFLHGIQNYGQTCYFSSVIQILRIIYFESCQFQQILFKLKDESNYIQSLLNLITKKSDVTERKIFEFYNLLDSNSFYLDGNPRDCSILFSSIIGKIRGLDANINNIFKSQFCIQQDYYQKVYKNCCYSPLWLQISDNYSHLEDCIKSQIYQTSGIYYKQIHIVKDPEILIISIQRVTRYQVQLKRKLEFTKQENQSQSKITYNLKGFIVGPKHNFVITILNDKDFYLIDDQQILKYHESLFQQVQMVVYKKCID